MFKKHFLLLLTCCLLLGGCGTDRSAPKKAGLCVRQRTELHETIQKGLEELGYTVTLADGVLDQARQNEQVRQLLTQGCQLLIVEPVLTGALDQVVEEARSKGVPVLFLEREPEQGILDSWEGFFYIGSDPAQPGQLQGQLTKALAGGYAVLCGPDSHLDARLHREGIQKALSKRKCADICCTDWSLDGARVQCARLLKAHGQTLQILLCGNADIAQGALEAAQNAGRIPGRDLYILAIGQGAPLLAQIQAGAVYATVCPDFEALANSVVTTVKTLSDGGIPPKLQYIPWQVIKNGSGLLKQTGSV